MSCHSFDSPRVQSLMIIHNELEEGKRQREIELLQKAQAIQQLELQRANELIYLFVAGIILFVTVIFLVLRSNRARRIANFRLMNQNHEIQNQRDEIESQRNRLQEAFENLKTAQAQLIQSEKMASLGLLTAGVAHEINNPINFVHAEVDGLTESLDTLIQVLNKYGEINASDDLGNAHAILDEIKSLKKQLYFEETQDGLFKVVGAIREGASRTAEIVNGLRNFSRLDETELKLANIHSGIDNTLLILSNELKKKQINIIKDYDHRIPIINCYAGQLNQVFMNILSNAIQASSKMGDITIATKSLSDLVQISVSDTGEGMTEEIKNKVFEPFFTTKEKQKGTGLGMSISFGIIEKHGGTIHIDSTPHKGTTINILIAANTNEPISEISSHLEETVFVT